VLLFDKGWSIAEIAEALLLSHDAIHEHVTEYKDSKKLKPENGGSIEKLLPEQSNQLEEHLQRHIYLYVKDIIAYVQSKWSVAYSVPGMSNWLQRHGFSYKKPAIVPGKADEQQQREWLAGYEKLKQNLPENETICFAVGELVLARIDTRTRLLSCVRRVSQWYVIPLARRRCRTSWISV